jgi:hypothetical protein
VSHVQTWLPAKTAIARLYDTFDGLQHGRQILTGIDLFILQAFSKRAGGYIAGVAFSADQQTDY